MFRRKSARDRNRSNIRGKGGKLRQNDRATSLFTRSGSPKSATWLSTSHSLCQLNLISTTTCHRTAKRERVKLVQVDLSKRLPDLSDLLMRPYLLFGSDPYLKP